VRLATMKVSVDLLSSLKEDFKARVTKIIPVLLGESGIGEIFGHTNRKGHAQSNNDAITNSLGERRLKSFTHDEELLPVLWVCGD
jgi:hypothetical protein